MKKNPKLVTLLLLPILFTLWVGTFYLADSTTVSIDTSTQPNDDNDSTTEQDLDRSVVFHDSSFEGALREELNHNGDFTIAQIQQIESLTLRDKNIEDISDVEHFTSLRSLDLRNNKISDISILSSLPSLIDLNLRGNKIEDITVLSYLTDLQNINLRENLIRDITALGQLSNLSDVNLRYNQINDIEPLAGITSLYERLYLNGNPIHDYTSLVDVYPYISEKDFHISPLFSRSAGFYDKEFSLELSTPIDNATIYYTLDGSNPDPINNHENTYEYNSPISITSREGESNNLSNIRTAFDGLYTFWAPPENEVFKSTVVKANVVTDGMTSDTVTNTYFVDDLAQERYSLPVISISTESSDLFDDDTGLFVNENWENRGRDWEREASMEFFEADGTLGFTQTVGVRVHGGWTREAPQKSLRIYARSDYDTNLIHYDLFSDTDNLTHKRLLLRNSGNDFHRTMFRDGFIQELVGHMKFDTQSFQPSIVFINGEYWGIHNIRERYDDWYITNQYGVDQEKVTILENDGELDNGSPDGIAHYKNLISFVEENDLSDTENYDYLRTQMDMENFIDYYIAQIYIANTDWPENNVRLWRFNSNEVAQVDDDHSAEDGRWRWLLFDTDFGFGVQPGLGFSGGSSVDTNALDRLIGEEWYQILFTSLLENEEFKWEFLARFSDLLNTTFSSERVLEQIDSFTQVYEVEMEEHIARWNIPPSYGTWENEVDVLREFAVERPFYQWKQLREFYDLEDTARVQLDMESSGGGVVEVNSIVIDEQSPGIYNGSFWEGEYFIGAPIKIAAQPMEGYTFVGWGDDIDQDSEAIEMVLAEDMVLSPVFEEDPS